MTNLYIDPSWGKPMAWAMYTDGELCGHGTFAGLKDIWAKITESDNVYCEDQVRGKSFESIKKLIRACGWVECICKTYERPFYLINPRTWKAHYGLNKMIPESMKWAIRLKVAEEINPWREWKKKDIDILDAIMMGAFNEWILSQGK